MKETVSMESQQLARAKAMLAEPVHKLDHLPKIYTVLTQAVAVAVLTAGVETQVVCRNLVDFYGAMDVLAGKAYAKYAGKWNAGERALEFPDGSAVAVKFEEKAP
jgi:hypothetical protein